MSEQPGQGHGVQTPERPPRQDAEAAAVVARRAAWLGVGGLLITLIFMPLGLILSIAGLVLGLRARRSVRHLAGATTGIVTGAVGVLLSLASIAVLLYISPQVSDLNDCLDAANTVADEQQCRDTYVPKIEKRLGAEPGTLDWAF
ncbi:DUF4190 domain-containing protein [Actinomadura parmotrematis]|uniref:DUF4190 domain-containing protein n=1 Tax=Actinomadura parmotrematis TaxID=2864039 RepID=A0ABS7G2I8_9ACTN|nr:DUF4190 domain-containing protein [Actinomadura parmotrematis]MBW8486936.1 DUF4190 domain-containing protein [Actinomadura parmotrematis]